MQQHLAQDLQAGLSLPAAMRRLPRAACISATRKSAGDQVMVPRPYSGRTVRGRVIFFIGSRGAGTP